MGARDIDSALLDDISKETRSAIYRAIRAGIDPLTVQPPVSLSKWAAEHFYLSAESSQKQEQWTPWPFQPGIMDAMSNDAIEEVDVMKSARVGYTKMLLACIAYDAHHRRRNQALWQPTDDDAASFVKTELEPMLRDVDVMQKVFPAFLAKNKDNTLQLKKFIGSVLHVLGGKAAKNYRRITVASAKLDEIDGFDQQIERSADPVTLARKRLEGATFPKLICGTTPRIKGLSHIEGRDLAAQARMRFVVPCVHCGVDHPLMWGGKDKRFGFKWENGDPTTARHVCPHCFESIQQADYLRMQHLGAWQSDCGNWRYGQDGVWRDAMGMLCKAPRHVSFRIWTAYSPQVHWVAIVREFLEACAKRKTGDKGPLQGFINETLGETWEDDDSERIEVHELKRRADDYPLRVVPMGGLVLLAGVDVQGNRFEVTVWAIGRGDERWVVDYCVIPANPADERDWEEKLDPYLQSTFPHAAGSELPIAAAAIDMMGSFTHQGYNFARLREARETAKVFAVRGDPQPGKPIGGRATLQDVNFRGKTLKRGVKLWYVGTDTAKDLLFGRLQIATPGPGYIHFSKHLPDAFFSGLTCEARVPVRTSSGYVTRWVNVHHARNEPLDCTVYAMFCEHRLGLHTMTDRQWQLLEERIQPANGDLFSPPRVAPEAQAVAGLEVVPDSGPVAVPSTSMPGRAKSAAFDRDW